MQLVTSCTVLNDCMNLKHLFIMMAKTNLIRAGLNYLLDHISAEGKCHKFHWVTFIIATNNSMVSMAVLSYQSIMSSPMTRISSRSRVNQFSTAAVYMPSLRRNATLRVQSMAGEEQKELPGEPANTVTPPAQTQPTPTCSLKMSTKFTDLMAFGGLAPERINGKLAMIGFVGAMGVEIANGQGVFEQISSGGISLFLGTSLLLSVASLVPLFQGVSVESKSKGLFSSDAELWNGRFAMLGLIALAFTEYVKGSTLV